MSQTKNDEDGDRQSPLALLRSLLRRKKLRRPLRLSEDHILSITFVRRARTAVFGENLFSDPAWDILLELYAARLGERNMLLPELARATDTPLSTTRRWISALEARGLVKVTSGVTDAASDQVDLTPEAASKLEHLGDHWGSAFVSI